MPTRDDNRTSHAAAKFGGFQFTHELELCFGDLSALLMQVLNSEVQNLPHPVGLVLGNVLHNAKAVLSLAPDQLVSEAYLVMRVLVDSAASATYLLAADEAERQRYVGQQTPTTFLKRGEPDDLISQAEALCDVDRIPSHRLGPIKERIDAFCARTDTKPDSWRVLTASIFPLSAEILAGSSDAYASRFRKKGSEGTEANGNEFSMLFFMGSEVLYELISLCSKHVNIGQILERARSIRDRVIGLMEKRDIGISDPAEGAWNRLGRLEHFGARKLSHHLSDLEEAFQSSYEAALIAPTLRREADRGKFKHAALYFRRALNDLRAVWLLLSSGYTAQASTSAGSLFESCLASICLLDPDRVQEFETWLKSTDGNDFPWGSMKMAQMVSAPTSDLNNPDPAYQNSWRSLYARYVWLSQIRHSTFQSVIHDVRGGMLNSGEYVLMAIPNCNEADLPVKLGIAVGALADTQEATGAMLKAFGYGEKTENALFDNRWCKAREELSSLVRQYSNMENPISIVRTRFLRRYPPIPNPSMAKVAQRPAASANEH
jgi:hypothetical protein